MAKIISWTEETKKAWSDWVKSRPVSIQAICDRLPPNRLYRLKPSGRRVTLYAYNEDGTLTVDVTGEYNFVVFDRRVVGVKPDDLEECDLPTNELLGRNRKTP